MTAFYIVCGFVFGAFITGGIAMIFWNQDDPMAVFWTGYTITSGILSFLFCTAAIWQESKHWNDPTDPYPILKKWRRKKNDHDETRRKSMGHERTRKT